MEINYLDAQTISEMNLNDLSKVIHELSKSKGFYDKEVNIPEKLMLVVSELSEALEADRNNNYSDLTSFETALMYDFDTEQNLFVQHIKDSFEDELADAVIRLLDLSRALNIDIASHVAHKIGYNSHRKPMHGKKY